MKAIDAARTELRELEERQREAMQTIAAADQRIAQLREEAPDEWSDSFPAYSEKGKQVLAKHTLGIAKPREGREYDRFRNAVAQAAAQKQAAQETQRALVPKMTAARDRVAALAARAQAGIDDAEGAFIDLVRAASVLHDHDPTYGKHRGGDNDVRRAMALRDARDAFDRLRQHSEAGWPTLTEAAAE